MDPGGGDGVEQTSSDPIELQNQFFFYLNIEHWFLYLINYCCKSVSMTTNCRLIGKQE